MRRATTRPDRHETQKPALHRNVITAAAADGKRRASQNEWVRLFRVAGDGMSFG
jgi:hypothetical protein